MISLHQTYESNTNSVKMNELKQSLIGSFLNNSSWIIKVVVIKLRSRELLWNLFRHLSF